ncbi:hypothetical protein OESDEN_17239, partial [Oesophagostomum dentatum]
MLKLVVLVALAAVACATWDGEIKDIPGVSAANMDKLRQLLNPRPANKEEFKAKIEQWMAGLSTSEKAAAEEFREQMHQKHHTGQ